MAKKVALGKGIASLIQNSPNEILKASLGEEQLKEINKPEKKNNKEIQNNDPYLIAISDIKTNPNQPRKIFKEKEITELSESIKENGVIQPLIVAKTEKGFELIAGERRLRASKLAGLEKVPVVIKNGTERDKMVMSIIENVQRSDLNCVEESLAYYQLMNEFNLTQEEVGKRLGKERSTIANYLRILKLPRQIIDQLQKELLSFGHAKILASEKDRDIAIRVANEVVTEGLSVRELEKRLKVKRKPSKPVVELENKKDEKFNRLREKLEKRTGYHFGIKPKSNGSGEFTIKFNNEAEFNDIFEYLLTR